MQIPENLLTFDFCIAWEDFKAAFDAINERYWLYHFSIIGPELSIKEMAKEIEIATKRPYP